MARRGFADDGTHKMRSSSKFLAALFVLVAASCAKKDSPSLANSRFFRGVEIIGHQGAGVGEFNKPRSVAVDRNDNLYVVDMTGRVQKFSPDGRFLLQWQMPQTDLGKPKGMATDRDGNIIVLEPHYQRLNHFSPEGKLIAQWGKSGTNRGEFTLPRAVAVNSRGEIFVSEYTRLDRVQAFSPSVARPSAPSTRPSPAMGESPSPILLLGQSGSGAGQFNRAEGLGIDSQNRLYVADSCNHRIEVFGPDGKWLRSHGKPGKGIGELSYPYDIRIDGAGNQFVCEFGNSRIQIFDAQDRPVEILGGSGSAPGEFSNPWAIALDSRGNLYVADAGNHRVQKFIRR